MRKISVLLSMVALFSFVAITSVSAKEREKPQTSPKATVNKASKPVLYSNPNDKKIEAKKDSNFDGKAFNRTPVVKNTTAPAPKKK